MKKLLWVLGLLPLATIGQEKKDAQFIMTGDIKGLTENTVVFITDASNPTDTLASDHAKGGHFVLKGHVGEPNIFELNLGSAKTKTAFFIGNDKMTVTGSQEDLKGLKVTGSASQSDYEQFVKDFTPYFTRINGIMQIANSPEGAKSRDSLHQVYKVVADSTLQQLDQFVAAKKS